MEKLLGLSHSEVPIPKEWTSWDYTPGSKPIARLLLDTNGIAQVLWMPVFLTPNVQVRFDLTLVFSG